MPEGDTLYRAARRLQPLVGEQVESVAGSSRVVPAWSGRMSGTTITTIESCGKHLLIHFDDDLTLRTHLGMTGVWHLYERGDPWRKTEGKARVVITTRAHTAVCFAAPDVSIGPRAAIEDEIAHLGPDLLGAEFDVALAADRAPGSDAAIVADLLLDQSVMAGVGNVYKSEILFLERLHPSTPSSILTRPQVESLAGRARRLLWANRDRGRRNTTGYGRRADLWVYGRDRRPCRRCGTAIASAKLGALGRSTYWCPRCQPEVT